MLSSPDPVQNDMTGYNIGTHPGQQMATRISAAGQPITGLTQSHVTAGHTLPPITISQILDQKNQMTPGQPGE